MMLPTFVASTLGLLLVAARFVDSHPLPQLGEEDFGRSFNDEEHEMNDVKIVSGYAQVL